MFVQLCPRLSLQFDPSFSSPLLRGLSPRRKRHFMFFCIKSVESVWHNRFHFIVSFDYNRRRQCTITVYHFRFHVVSIYNDKCWGYRKKSHQYHLSASRQEFCSVVSAKAIYPVKLIFYTELADTLKIRK
jgi:hypothetical protein